MSACPRGPTREDRLTRGVPRAAQSTRPRCGSDAAGPALPARWGRSPRLRTASRDRMRTRCPAVVSVLLGARRAAHRQPRDARRLLAEPLLRAHRDTASRTITARNAMTRNAENSSSTSPVARQRRPCSSGSGVARAVGAGLVVEARVGGVGCHSVTPSGPWRAIHSSSSRTTSARRRWPAPGASVTTRSGVCPAFAGTALSHDQ
jgi:hypothetical protein